MYNCLKMPTSRFRKLLAALFVFTTIVIGAQAADRTWTGNAGDNDWNNATNWNPQAVPGEADTVIFNSAATIALTNDITVTNLQILSDTNIVTLDFSAAPNHSLTIKTRLRLGNNPTGHLVLANAEVKAKEFDTNDNGINSLKLNNTKFTLTGNSATDRGKLLKNGTGTTTISADAPATGEFVVTDTVDIPDNYNGTPFAGVTIVFDSGVTVSSPTTIWTGRTSSEWDNNGNWLFGIPSDDSAVVIPDVTPTPELSTASAELKSIAIDVNAKFTLSSGGTLSVGKITNHGTITIKDGSITGTTSTPAPDFINSDASSIVYDGASSPVWGDTYNNLEIKSGSLTLNDDININNAFTINSDFVNNAEITAKGNVTSTNNMSGTGKITFAGSSEQTFAGGGKQYSNVEIKNNVIITGNNEFGTLAVNSIGGKTINFGATTQTVTSNLTLKGSGTGNRLALTGTGWELNCTGTSDIQYTNIDHSTATQPLVAVSSVDGGYNVNWSFPGNTYTWTGATDDNWFDPGNWDKQSVPGLGAQVIIDTANPAKLNNNVTLSDATYIGKITIKSGAIFDIAGQNVILGTGDFINNGRLRLQGVSSQSITGTMSNGTFASSVVEYYGGSSTDFIWNSNQYKNLEFTGGAATSATLTVTGTVTIAAGSDSVSFSADGSVTIADNAQAGNLSITCPVINLTKVTTSGTQSYTGSVNGGAIEIANGGTCTFNDNVTATSLSLSGDVAINCASITTTGAQTYDGQITFAAAGGATTLTAKNGATYNTITIKNSINGSYTPVFDSNVAAILAGGMSVNTSLEIKGNFSDTGIWTLVAGKKLIFSGDANQTFTAGTSTYSNIELSKPSGKTVTFEGNPTITNITEDSNAGNIIFNSPVTIQSDTTFDTTGSVSFKDATFELSGTKKSISHTNGNTITNGTIDASNIEFNTVSLAGTTSLQTSGATILNGNVSVTGGAGVSLTIDGAAVINCAGITTSGTTTFKGGNVSSTNSSAPVINGDLEIGTSAAGITVGIPLTAKGNVTFKGSNTFASLTATGLGGKTFTFEGGKTQTINGTLELSGNSTSSRLKLCDDESGTWYIDCTDPVISFVDVINSTSTREITATGSTDSGNNVRWNFPGQTYQWLGEAADGSKTNWQNAGNWNPASLPGQGAVVTIPAGKNNYPQLSANVNIGTGSIAIANIASLDMNGFSFTAATINNSGKVLLQGTETIQGTITNANTSTVEYYGTGSLTSFNWKNGQFYNLILSQPVDISDPAVSDAIQVTGATQILAGTGTVNLDNANNIFNGTVTIGNSTTSAGSVTLSGKKTNGTAITLADGVYATSLTLNSNVQGAELTINAPLIVNAASITTTGNQTYNNTVTLKAATTTFTAASGKTIEFKDTVTGEAGTEALVTSGGTAVFYANVNVGSLSTQAATITNAVTITTLAGDTIQFLGAINGSGSLTTSTGNVIFNGTVSGLSSITANAGAKINTASITTTGTQTYNGAITLAPTGKQTTLTASGNSSEILLKAAVSSTNGSSLTAAGVLKIGNNGGSGITISVPLTVQNDTYFYSDNTLTSLTATSMGGKSITFEAGKTQTFSGKLSLAGANGSLLSLKSSGAGTAWKINCTGSDNHSINYVDVKDSDNSQTSYYLTASNSTDSGNNTNWAFPDMAYKWTGANNSTDWSNPQNWSPQSVPNAGNGILIPASTPEYPVIDETVALAQTTINIEDGASFGVTTSGDFTAATITNGGTVEVSDGKLTVTTLVNSQTVNLTGGQIVIPTASGATFTNNSTVNISAGTITGARSNGDGSIVIYNGTGNTSPVWGNDYKNLQIANGCSVSFVNDITVGNDFTNNGSASIDTSKKINVAGNVTSTGNITGDGTLNFNGSGDQSFTPNNMNYPAITASSAGAESLIIDGKVNAVSINSARTTKLNDKITTSGEQTYVAVLLDGNTELDATGSTINLNSTVSGDHSLTTSGTTKIKGNITTKGGQTYNNTVNLLAGVTLTDDAGQLIKFVSEVSGAYSLQIVDANSEFGSTVTGVTTLTTDANTEFKDTVSVGSLSAVNANINCASITTGTTQAYSGNLTLTKSPTLTGTTLTFGGDVKSSANGYACTITFDKCSSVNNSSANVSADISYEFKNSSVAAVTTAFTPGSSIYHDITSQNITLNFGNNDFTQASGSTFTVNSGIVNMGSGGVALGNLTVDGGTFRQTGDADDSVNDITFTSGTIIWDSSDAGGTLAINGTISGAAAANINYHKKEVTINETQEISGTFWSLVIPAGKRVTNGDSISIRKNLTIESTGSYVHNDKTLTFGTDAEDGEISVGNFSSVNLGSVVLNKTSADSKLQAKTNLLFTDLTVTKGTFDIPSEKTVQTTNLTIETNGKLANAETLNVTGNMTDSGTYIGDGTIYFTGSGNQNFTPKAGTAALHTTYKNIENTSANPLNIKADIWAENFTIGSGETTTFEQKSEIGNLTIISAQETNFAKYASIESLTDSPTAGDIVFTEGAVINENTTLNTSGTVTFNQTVDIGENGNKTFEHTTGDTVINGTLNASSAKFEDLQLNGTVDAITELYGNLTTTASPEGSATFTQNVSVLGNTDADLDAPVTVQGDFIIQKDSGKAVNIKQNLSITQNFALYSGDVKLKANIFTGKDVIMLGSDYSTNDTSTGYANAYAYKTPRPNDNWSQPRFDDFSDSVKAGSLEADAGTIIHVGKNFYANGITLNNSTTNSGTWYIDIPVTSDSESAFAEAYKCTVTRCTVRKHDGTTAAGTVDSDNAQIVAENGCSLTDCANWDSDEFEIINVWTTRDNVVYVEFNRPVRNLHGEFNDAISNFTYFVSANNDTSYSSAATQPDGSEALTSDANGEKTIIYLVAPVTWNTDATGSNAGVAKSTDRNGNHKTSVPYIDIPRSLGTSTTASQSYVITDRFGKRLKHYSGASRITTVLDKTGPVLVEVRTGQETHETNLANQAAYDAHNFIEFIYSEAVFFGNHADTINTVGTQNIQVTNALGIVTSTLTSDTDLTFAGIGVTIEEGQMQTRKAGVDSDDATMNAMYRDSTHSLKISLAGYAQNVSSNGTITGSYIIWPGYIEQAVLPQGEVSTTATPASPNTVVTDTENNQQIMQKTGLTVNSLQANGTNYGVWDTQEPVFVKVHKHGEDTALDYYEALGNGDGSTLNRIEIHVSDNPSSDESFNKYWLTGYGWTTDPSGTLLSSAADNLVGGSRPFDSLAVSNATTGGLRYCTILNQESAFKYEVGETDSPTQNFTLIEESASAPFFAGASDTRNNIPLAKDNTYISLSLSDTSLPYKTTFTVSYDSTSSYITDLAGNRLKSVSTMKTLDRTSPDFKISFSPVNQNKIFLLFVKQLRNDIVYNGEDIDESFEEIIPYCFELGTISGSTWTTNSGSALQIDTSVPASIISSKSNSYYTAVELTLNQNATMEDIEETYIRLKPAGTVGTNTYGAQSKDPITGLDNSYVTFIQDVVGNYMPMYQAHALSDFAANMVNPLYAYNDDIEYREENLTYSLYEPESWAVHDWNKEQQNYGTLLAQKPVTVIANLDTSYFADASGDLQYTLRMFYSKNPTAGSESDEYNADIHDSLRLWAPDNSNFANNGLFPAYAAVTNQNYDYVDAVPLDTDLSKGVEFNFTETIAQNFTHGSQISFLFGVFDAGVQKSICLNPVLTMSGGSASYNVSAQTPLYIIRLKNPGDITSLDLWSFRVKSVAAQRGNVSIMNNVINADNGEKVVIKVDLKQKGNLNVLVMTLDGNIVDYLQRGEAEEGEHFYSWDGTNRRGKTVARGMYFVRVTGPGIDETRKVLVVK